MRALVLAHRSQPLWSACAPIGCTELRQLLGVALVEVRPLRLDVGRMRAADLGSFVPLQAEPAERLDDERLAPRDVALLVGVLDAQDELTVTVACSQPRKQRGANRSEMQRARGRWREAGAHRRAGVAHS